jgi:hypothetical protein
MNNVVPLNEILSLYQSKKDLSAEEYDRHLSAIKSANTTSINELQDQNDNLIKLLENTHYTHEKHHSELLQLRETVSDLRLDVEDERIDNKQLREKLSSVSKAPESLSTSENIIRSVNATAKLEEANHQLLIRLQESEKKHATARSALILAKQEILKQFDKQHFQTAQNTWQDVSSSMPKESGIYLLTDGIQQCVGYFNQNQAEFAKTTYFSMPTHWMARPDMPK